MDLMENIKEFLESEELISFFEIKGYRPLAEKGWFRLLNIKNNTIERMGVFKDINNEKRIRFKGKNWAFSLNRDNNDKLYLDHLLIGDVEKNEYTFIMRHNIDENNNNEFIVKLVDNKNIKHIYHIKDDCIHITKETLPPKEFEYNKNNKDNKFIEKQSNKNDKIIEEFFYFKGKDNKPALLDCSKEYQDACKQEFVILENSYISITSFIAKRIPFLSTCINEKANDNVKLYEIKRKERTTKPYEKAAIDDTKIYQFTRKKNNQ